jgi:valyl-tRNA synthetase
VASTLSEKQWKKELEPALYTAWKAKQLFKLNESTTKKIYSIDTPPPYVNTPIHIGQATTYVLMDMFARFHRMTGFDIVFPLGLDRNGLPIEMAAEKQFGISVNKTPRVEFLRRCEEMLEASSLESVESFLRLGISFNSWEEGDHAGDLYKTDSASYRALTQATFVDMYNKGLIYESERTNNWCPGCQTTLADAEVEYAEISSFFNDIYFTVKETGEKIVIATTRPELIPAIGMVIYNPDDDRYKHLEGKTAIIPIFNKHVPIRAHPIAQIDKGTGLMMMCSFGDISDIRFFREMNLTPTICINKDGTLNQNAGEFQGLKTKDAQKKIIMKLSELGMLKGQKRIVHRTPVCERSKDPIEFIAMTEYYVKQVEFKEDMRKLTAHLSFYAPESRQIMLDWIDSVSIDWPISRRRFYATEVPVWYCKKCREVILAPKGKYVKPWKEPCPVKSCPKCQSNEFVGDERVFDTWFDSSISPLYILKYGRDDAFFKKHTPCTLRPQGKEIIRTWLYYTVLKDWLLTGKCIFSDVYINYHIIDEEGYKMSKSKGNGIDPRTILDKFGAEPFRLWTAVEGNLEKTDFRCSFDRIEGAGKTLSKLWNVARFIDMITPEEWAVRFKGQSNRQLHNMINHHKITPLDQWIINEINTINTYAKEHYEKYDFHGPAVRIRNFIWEAFASQYLELVKNRAYNQDNSFTQEEQASAIIALNYVLNTTLEILSPILPFITEKIYYDMRSLHIYDQEWPPVIAEVPMDLTKDDLEMLNSLVWKAKKDKSLSLKAEVASATIPEKFKFLEKDFKSTHAIKELKYGDETKVNL